MIKLPLVFVAEPNVVVASLKKISPPSASNTTSPAVSIIKSPVSFTMYELVPP